MSASDLHVHVGRLVIDAAALEGGRPRREVLEASLRSALERQLQGGSVDSTPGAGHRSNPIAETIAARVTTAIEPTKGR
jgi:hypothetical protein